MQIKTVAKKVGREVTTDSPDVLEMETLEELVKALGEDLCVQQIKSQLMVSFRAMIRRMLEATDDNEEPIYDDDQITNKDYSDWKPSLRVSKSPEEKALEALGALPPEVRQAVLANFDQ